MDDTLERWVDRGLWLVPVYGAFTLAATWTHQPDPATDFTAWSDFVTTGWFYGSHLVGSLLGLAVGTLGVMALGLRVVSLGRPRAAMTAVVLHVVGAAVVQALFGVAAFVQPAMGAAFLSGEVNAQGWYDAVFDSAATLGPAFIGLAIFSSASVVMAWACRPAAPVPTWVVMTLGASAPLIGVLGVAVGVLQTAGSIALIVSGVALATRLRSDRRDETPGGVRSAADVSVRMGGRPHSATVPSAEDVPQRTRLRGPCAVRFRGR